MAVWSAKFYRQASNLHKINNRCKCNSHNKLLLLLNKRQIKCLKWLPSRMLFQEWICLLEAVDRQVSILLMECLPVLWINKINQRQKLIVHTSEKRE